MVEQRDGNTDRRYQEAFLSVAAQLGMANRAPHDVLVALTDRLTERDHLHQVVADIAEAGGVRRDSPVRDLTDQVREMSGQAPMPLQLTEIVGMDHATPARTVLQAIRQALSDREALVNLVADVKRQLQVPLEADAATLMHAVYDLQDQAKQGNGVAFAGRIRQALGLRQEATHQQIVDAIAELLLKTKMTALLADRLDMRGAGAPQLLERVGALRTAAEAAEEMYGPDSPRAEDLALYRELAEEVRSALELPPESRNAAVLNRIANLQATVADLTEPVVETLTMDEVARQREERRTAIGQVLEMWREHQMGDVPSVDDLVAMAEYLVSGDTQPAAAVNDLMVRRAMDRQQGGPVDGARWTPGDADSTRG